MRPISRRRFIGSTMAGALAAAAGVPVEAAVTVDPDRLPTPREATLNDDDVRRVLHVTFGSVLADGTLATRLGELREEYAADLEHHLARHLQPFA